MLTIVPNEIPTAKLHAYLLGAVGPRPIALASTVDEQGRPNLSPFSFFNVFSSNPPVLIFAPNRRVRDNTNKDTYANVKAVPEVVINVVSWDMVQQVSLSSSEYGKGVNEFEKAGFTMLASEQVRPFRVAESPVQFECSVRSVIELGDKGGAGNLILCEVLRMHVQEDLLDEQGQIDQFRIDLVSRMGGNWYSRARNGLFEVPKPLSTPGIGVDVMPEEVRRSDVLTGNDLGMLGNVPAFPSEEEVKIFKEQHPELSTFWKGTDPKARHLKVKELLAQGSPEKAWCLLLA